MEIFSVKDRLPEKQGHYLVWAPRSFPKNTPWVVAEFYDDNNIFYSESSDNPMEDVTHWGFLPPPPSSHNSDYAVKPSASPKFPKYDDIRQMFPDMDTILFSAIYHAIKYSGNFA